METWSDRIARQMHAKQRICGSCGKVCYDSEKEANRVIREYRERVGRRPYYLRSESPANVPKRAYLDKRCGTWHVTSSRSARERRAADVEAFGVGEMPFLRLPPPPEPCGKGTAAYLEALTLGLRDEIRRQGSGLRLPYRRALERHYGVSWAVLAQARNLLVETGWLRPLPDDAGQGYVTGHRIIAETSREGPASLSA